nr:MAG TPA: hypothetical protein [Caudoviricetes sp.]
MNNLPTKILGANNVSTQNLNRQHYWRVKFRSVVLSLAD